MKNNDFYTSSKKEKDDSLDPTQIQKTLNENLPEELKLSSFQKNKEESNELIQLESIQKKFNRNLPENLKISNLTETDKSNSEKNKYEYYDEQPNDLYEKNEKKEKFKNKLERALKNDESEISDRKSMNNDGKYIEKQQLMEKSLESSSKKKQSVFRNLDEELSKSLINPSLYESNLHEYIKSQEDYLEELENDRKNLRNKIFSKEENFIKDNLKKKEEKYEIEDHYSDFSQSEMSKKANNLVEKFLGVEKKFKAPDENRLSKGLFEIFDCFIKDLEISHNLKKTESLIPPLIYPENKELMRSQFSPNKESSMNQISDLSYSISQAVQNKQFLTLNFIIVVVS